MSARLAALWAAHADAESAESAKRWTASSPAGAIGAIGANGIGTESTREAGGGFGPAIALKRNRAAVAGLLRGFAGTGPQPTLEDLA